MNKRVVIGYDKYKTTLCSFLNDHKSYFYGQGIIITLRKDTFVTLTN